MGYGVELSRQRLSQCLTEPIQRVLSMACLPEGPEVFVDRIDLGTVATFNSPPGAPGSVDVSVPLQIYQVTLAELSAHPNQSPPQLSTPASHAVLHLRLQTNGTALSATVTPPDLSGTGIPSPLQAQLAGLIANAASSALAGVGFDAAPLIASLGLPAPATVQLALTPASMVVEYDAGGARGNRLGGGQEWGLFIDVQPALDLALGKLPAALRSGLVSSSAAWAPDGTVPRVHAQVELDVGLFSFKAPLDIRLSLLPAAPGQPSARLRADVTWDIEVDAMTIMGIPVAVLLKLAGFPGMAAVLASESFAEVLELGLDGVAELADKDIEKAFVQAGAQRTGHRSYAFEQALPALAMFGIELRPLSLLASGAGMTLGGVVRVQAVSREPMRVGVNRFGLPFFPTTCRKSGGVRPKVRADQVRYGAGAHFHDMGRFCGARLMPHDAVAAALIEPRLDSTTAATDGFGFHLDLQEANTLHSDVRLLVRTSRGTRVVDLGRPVPAVLDEDGNVTNVAGYLPNCLTYSTEDKHSLIFGDDDDTLLTRDDLVRPMEEPDWALQVQNDWGIEVQLVAVTGLEPGETVVYQSPTHRVQVAADRGGRVLLPGFAPLGVHVAPAQLQRLGQGRLTREEVRLVGSMSLQGGGLLRPLADGDDFADEGGLHRRPDWRAALSAMNIGAVRQAGLRSQPMPGGEAALNPQPLPPGLDALNPQPLPPEPPPSDHPLVRATGLRDVHAVHAVPGAESGQLAIAVMKDGRKLVLDGSADRPRVAGTFEGPIGRVVVGDGFAVAPAGGQLRLFEVHA